MDTPWPGIVNAILYRVQFDRALDTNLARRVAIELVTDPLWSLTAEEEYNALAFGLDSGSPIPSDALTSESEKDIRLFLSEVAAHMQELRPWPKRPFDRLPENRLSNFLSAHPIARIKGSVNDIESLMRCAFSNAPDFGEFLLIRLNSGAEVGFLHPYNAGLDGTVVTTRDPGAKPHEIVAELHESASLKAAMFIIMDQR